MISGPESDKGRCPGNIKLFLFYFYFKKRKEVENKGEKEHYEPLSTVLGHPRRRIKLIMQSMNIDCYHPFLIAGARNLYITPREKGSVGRIPKTERTFCLYIRQLSIKFYVLDSKQILGQNIIQMDRQLYLNSLFFYFKRLT